MRSAECGVRRCSVWAVGGRMAHHFGKAAELMIGYFFSHANRRRALGDRDNCVGSSQRARMRKHNVYEFMPFFSCPVR